MIYFQNNPRALVFVVLFLFIVSCAPTEVITSPSSDENANNDLATPTSAVKYTWCKRPYNDSSIWNIPIDWTKARIHPDNEAMMNAFFENETWIGSNASQYTANVYFVSNRTPLVPVKLREYRFRNALNDINIQYGEPGGTVWMPLPPEARPARGTDGQLAIINLDSGEEWGIIRGAVNSQGNWLAGGIYLYHIDNSGIPPEGFGQRGAGIGQFAGIVRPCEIERGYIGHAVTIAYDYPCAPEVCQANNWPAVIPPFRRTDGKGMSKYDIPEGAHLVIRPEISRKEIYSACSGVLGCIVWVLNMQEYGGFIVDDSGHPKTYAEGDATANWDPNIWFADMLRNIPREWYAVIDWNYPST